MPFPLTKKKALELHEPYKFVNLADLEILQNLKHTWYLFYIITFAYFQV